MARRRRRRGDAPAPAASAGRCWCCRLRTGSCWRWCRAPGRIPLRSAAAADSGHAGRAGQDRSAAGSRGDRRRHRSPQRHWGWLGLGWPPSEGCRWAENLLPSLPGLFRLLGGSAAAAAPGIAWWQQPEGARAGTGAGHLDQSGSAEWCHARSQAADPTGVLPAVETAAGCCRRRLAKGRPTRAGTGFAAVAASLAGQTPRETQLVLVG